MRAISLLQSWVELDAVIGHRTRVGALVRVVEALLVGSKLNLTQPGRHRRDAAYAKHHIKAVDRLLGTRH